MPWYELRLCAERPGPVPVIGGASLHSPYGLDALAAAGTLIVPGVPDVLYLDDGDVCTSAGSAAGLDLCVHLVRRDHGVAIANAVARRLVIAPHRDGGQAQFIETPVTAGPDDDRIAGSLAWALAHLTEPLTVARLARQAHMSPRTYLRHFARAMRTSPSAYRRAFRADGDTAPTRATGPGDGHLAGRGGQGAGT
uniref:hypothetical protein n=1 Tax=Micromonospora craniellae TaxID=2294034 RepID=UPI002678BAAC